MAVEKYHIGEALFKTAVHHQSFEQLWETKWKAPCTMGVYPFMFASIVDFEPIVQAIIEKGLKEPYDWNEYARMFFPKAEELFAAAEAAERAGNTDKASEYFLRCSAVYRIARFPAPRSDAQRHAWEEGKRAFYRGAVWMTHPIREVLIPHTHALPSEGHSIPCNILLPPTATPHHPAPLVLILTGLDGYRTELAVWQRGWLDKGVATLVVEIPGTGDSPAAPNDPTGPDRQWSSVLDWVAAQDRIDARRVVVWGFSTGGYYALRMAHTHADKLLGCVSHGGGAHHMFDAAWLQHVNGLEYPFDLADTLACKFGYASLANFVAESHKFSLVRDGTLDRPCCRTLLVNGSDDEIFPIEDLWVALQHGGPKEARVVRGKKHMGEPESFGVILTWIYALLGLEGEVGAQLRKLPMKCRY